MRLQPLCCLSFSLLPVELCMQALCQLRSTLGFSVQLCPKPLCHHSSVMGLGMQLLHKALQLHLGALQTQQLWADLPQQLPIPGTLLHQEDHTLLQQLHQVLHGRSMQILNVFSEECFYTQNSNSWLLLFFSMLDFFLYRWFHKGTYLLFNLILLYSSWPLRAPCSCPDPSIIIMCRLHTWH